MYTFGEKVFEVTEAAPDRLREVDGIGPVRAASIVAAWAEQKAVREIMVFLHSHCVGGAPRRFGVDPIRDVQVLCPMNRGGAGARSLNIELQAALNPVGEQKVERSDRERL